jgi:hypothetical protein
MFQMIALIMTSNVTGSDVTTSHASPNIERLAIEATLLQHQQVSIPDLLEEGSNI